MPLLLGDGDGGTSLGLESLENFPLGLHDDVRLASSDEEGETLVLAAAHLNLGSGHRLNHGQFLVGITSKSFSALPFFSRNMEHLGNGSGSASSAQIWKLPIVQGYGGGGGDVDVVHVGGEAVDGL